MINDSFIINKANANLKNVAFTQIQLSFKLIINITCIVILFLIEISIGILGILYFIRSYEQRNIIK